MKPRAKRRLRSPFVVTVATSLAGLVAAGAADACGGALDGDPSAGAGDGGLRDARWETGPSVNPPRQFEAAATCPTTTAIPWTQYEYKPAAKSPGACTAQMVDDLIAFVESKKNTVTYAEAKASVTDAACKACLFTVDPGDATTWGPLVATPKDELVLINAGGCVEVASGKVECGKTYHQLARCVDEACADCPEGDAKALDICRKAAATGACKLANAAIPPDCADAIRTCVDIEEAYTFEAPARVMCVGLGDAGDGG